MKKHKISITDRQSASNNHVNGKEVVSREGISIASILQLNITTK